MSTFDEREAAFEAKFAQDEERQFLARMRRDRFIAVWASALKGETVAQARKFGDEVIKKDLREVGDEDVVEAVKAYLGDLADEDRIRAKLVELLAEAKFQMMHEE